MLDTVLTYVINGVTSYSHTCIGLSFSLEINFRNVVCHVAPKKGKHNLVLRPKDFPVAENLLL